MNDTVSNSLLHGLACAALEPGLQQVLLFDADFMILETAVSHLRQILHITTGQNVRVISLPGTAQDDDLWGHYIPDPTGLITPGSLSGMTVTWQEGWLTQNRQSDDWLLVIIPDLSLLSLSVTRTCLMLMDTPVAHLERHGQHAHWTPRICWLASCPRDAIGKVSPHLLDRFSLRLSPPPILPKRSPEVILAWLTGSSPSLPYFAANGDLPDIWRERLAQTDRQPELSLEAENRVVAYSQNQGHPGLRRELALTRIGRGLAALAGEKIVDPRHIDEAAVLIGLTMPLSPPESQPEPEPSAPELPKHPEPVPPSPLPDPTEAKSSLPPMPSEPIVSDEEEIMPPSSLPPVTPYPEDNTPIDREQFSLQVPLRRTAHAAERGVIVGVQPAYTLQNLALIPTIFEAAMYQKIRHKYHPELADRFVISPADLRRHRRVPPPEMMLLLLLDYTSFHDCEWQQALIPHLRWAYVNRASITVIQVGSSRADDELRAQKVAARSLLTPRIAETLEPQPGRATPLAHGLEIAYQTIQQAQQHGRAFIQHTRLVIITDGRGNVPLVASASGQVQMPVNREGIEDALHVAQQFTRIKRLDAFLLDPQPAYHAELPLNLAEAIGAQHIIVPLIEEARL